MTKSDFIKLHLNLRIQINKTSEYNPLDSDTDPTQDIPITMIEVTSMGVPTNVKERQAVFSNIKAENFTTIEKRFNDQFDQLGELQSSVSQLQNKNITTNYVKPSKKQKKHEI